MRYMSIFSSAYDGWAECPECGRDEDYEHTIVACYASRRWTGRFGRRLWRELGLHETRRP